MSQQAISNYGVNTSTNLNSNFAVIQVGGRGLSTIPPQPSAYYGPLLINCAYFILAVTATPGVATFQALGLDGTWRSLVMPAPITLVQATVYNNPIPGTFRGLRINISGASGAGGSFMELSATIQS